MQDYEFQALQGFYDRVRQGKVPGHKWINKFYENPNIAIVDPPVSAWEYNTLYTYTVDAGAAMYFSSSNNADTQELEIYVLTVDSNGNWNEETIVQSLAGNTKTLLVTPSGDPIVRVYRAENNATSGNDIAGMVYIYEDDTTTTPGVPDTPSKVRAVINDGNNQTLMCQYSIPTGYVGIFKKVVGNVSRGAGSLSQTHSARASLKTRRFGKVFKVKGRVGINTNGSSVYSDETIAGAPLPAKTDLDVVIEEVTAAIGVSGQYDVMLIDEDLFSDSFLTAIGQIKRV